MNKSTLVSRLLIAVACISWVVSIAWLIYQPGFEPLLAFLGGIAALVAALFVRDASSAGALKMWIDRSESSSPPLGETKKEIKGGTVIGTATGKDTEVSIREGNIFVQGKSRDSEKSNP